MHLRGWLSLAAGLPLVLPLAGGLALALVLAAPVGAATLPEDPAPARVRLTTEDKLELAATYFAPREAKQKARGVVLVHGAGGSRKELDQLAAKLQKSGFAAVTVDLRGHGENAAEALDWKNLDEDGRQRTWAFASRDVAAAIDFLVAQKGVHSTTVSLVGYGAGCTLVSRQATRDERVRELALISPSDDKLGGSLLKDLVELHGLPVYVAVGKDETALAKRIAEATQKGGAAASSVETSTAKVDAAGLLADAKASADVVRWMKAKAQPSAKAAETKPLH